MSVGVTMGWLEARRFAGRTVKGVAEATRMSWRRSTWRKRREPDFLIIGAQRCGTSSLYGYLTRHPQIAAAVRKEVHFFDDNFLRGMSWYRAHFPSERELGSGNNGESQIITGEGSPYYLYHPAVPQRVSQTVPGVKLIALLRNPVERAYSHYHHECRMGRESLSFEEAIDREPERLAGEGQKLLEGRTHYSLNHRSFSYVARGAYVDQLRAWEQYFPREQLLILKSEDFYADTPATLATVLEFLGLPHWSPASYRKPSYPGYPGMDETIRRRLVEHFEPHNQRLYEHLGRRFDW